MAEERNALNTRDFSKVILTLNNVEIPEEKLSPTPSEKDGLNAEDEADLRILGCELIQTSGILLKLPQVAMATGQVLFQRFYYSKSFIKHPMEVVAMACVTLASKIEEAPRRFRDVISVFHHIKQVRAGKTISPMILDGNYINLKNQVIKAERRILKELGFCVHVKHPHKIIVMYLQVLECERNQRLVQYAWNYMNDSFRTNVFVRFRPETIACACIYLAARQLKIVLPNNPPWYGLFEADESELREISLMIMRLYTRPKPNPERLEQIVNELKKVNVEAKLRARRASNNATPNSGSRPATPSRVDSPMFAQLRRIKMEDDRKSEQSFGKDLPKKRSHSPDSRDSLSISHSRSRSRSPRSSKSHSRSPAAKRRPRTPPKYKEREKKPKYDKYSYDTGRYSRNDKYTSSSKDRNDKYYYEDSRYVKKDKYSSRERDYYDHKDYKPKKPSPIIYTRERSPSYSPEVRMKKKYKEKHKARSRSRSYDKYETKRKSKKHANGHRRSRSRDKYKKSM